MDDSKLLALRDDICVIITHLSERKLPTIRLIGNLLSTGNVTLMGVGWTMYVTITEKGYLMEKPIRVIGLRFFGVEDRFDEDFLVSKMSI